MNIIDKGQICDWDLGAFHSKSGSHSFRETALGRTKSKEVRVIF